MSDAKNFPPVVPISKPSEFQKTLFPFSEFSADDPNVTASPKLTLRAIWSFVSTFIGNLTGNVTGFASLNAPLPQTGAGVGQELVLSAPVSEALYLTDTGRVGGVALVGTWQWLILYGTNAGGVSYGAVVGQNAGGTQIHGAVANITFTAWCRRVA